jgi:F420-dependent oxidoreductase-like protein
MQLRIFTEPQQGATYDQLLGVAQDAERLGFDAFFRSDHYQRIGEGDPGPGSTDAWMTLAAIARETKTIRLGTLVTPVTFRFPGSLAIQVAQADAMSGGRVELGLGAGWYEAEHAAYGLPFPDTRTRFDLLEEQLAVITGLWRTPVGETFDYEGSHYRVAGSPALPKPVSSAGPPIIVGGHGKRRTPALAARYADEFNVGFSREDVVAAQFARVREACERVGRAPETMTWSNALTVCCGRDRAEVRRRAEAIGRDLDELRRDGVAGTPAECVETLGRYAAAGTQRVYLQVLDLADLDHLDLIAAEVRPHV